MKPPYGLSDLKHDLKRGFVTFDVSTQHPSEPHTNQLRILRGAQPPIKWQPTTSKDRASQLPLCSTKQPLPYSSIIIDDGDWTMGHGTLDEPDQWGDQRATVHTYPHQDVRNRASVLLRAPGRPTHLQHCSSPRRRESAAGPGFLDTPSTEAEEPGRGACCRRLLLSGCGPKIRPGITGDL